MDELSKNLERYLMRQKEILESKPNQRDLELIADAFMVMDDLIPEFISLKNKVKESKISVWSILFRCGIFKDILQKTKEKEEIFIKSESDAIKAIQILEGDMKRAKTVGNVIGELKDSIPMINSFYNRIDTIRFLIQSLKTELADLKSNAYVNLSLFLAILSVLLGLTAIL